MNRPVHFALYADLDANIVDGSSVWLAATADILASVENAKVTLVLKTAVESDVLVGPLRLNPRIKVVDPSADPRVPNFSVSLSPNGATHLLETIDTSDRFDAVVVRQMRAAERFARSPQLSGRLWTYLTDLPQRPEQMTDQARDVLQQVFAASRFILCQTSEMRSFLDAWIPGAGMKTEIFPPSIPSLAPAPRAEPRERSAIQLVYSGKFAPDWRAEEILNLPELLTEAGEASLTTIGDKVHKHPNDPTWQKQIIDRLQASRPRYRWRGRVPREEAVALAAECDIGVSWRTEALDDSLELSTKVLEYAGQGLPVLLNRTPKHEALLGADYPYFVATTRDIVDCVVSASRGSDSYARAAEACWRAAKPYTRQASIARITALVRKLRPTWPGVAPTATVRIAAASHDWKFFTPIQNYLEALPRVQFEIDDWTSLREHNEAHSKSVRDRNNIIICEWLGGNAVWYSRNKRPDQTLIIRFHRFEKDTEFPHNLVMDAVDCVICVNEYYRHVAINEMNIPAAKVCVIGNWVDHTRLDRPKLAGARWRLGVIGAAPSRKRLDRAVGLLAELKALDERYSLHVKGRQAWGYDWIWRRDEERQHYEAVFRRVNADPALRDSVVYDPFGADVAEWLRKIGFVLSVSDDESFHLAPAEGMASRACPAILRWPGAETVYDERWIADDLSSLARKIHNLASTNDKWLKAGEDARLEVTRRFTIETIGQAWASLIAQNARAPQTEAA